MKPTILFLSLFALVSCKPGSETPPPGKTPDKTGETTGDTTGGSTASSPALKAILLPKPPANALSVTEARKDPSPGKQVTIAGDILGRHDVFVPNRAMLILGDPNVITACNRIPGDECPAPWDVCCDDPDVVSKSIATVQVVDADGKLLKSGLKGLGGIKELSQLVVQGTIADGSGPDNLIVNASGIHIASVEANTTPKRGNHRDNEH